MTSLWMKTNRWAPVSIIGVLLNLSMSAGLYTLLELIPKHYKWVNWLKMDTFAITQGSWCRTSTGIGISYLCGVVTVHYPEHWLFGMAIFSKNGHVNSCYHGHKNVYHAQTPPFTKFALLCINLVAWFIHSIIRYIQLSVWNQGVRIIVHCSKQSLQDTRCTL